MRVVRRPCKTCSVCGGPHYCKGLCARHYQAKRHACTKRIKHHTNDVAASPIGSVYVNRISGGRFGVFIGQYDTDEFFDPQLVSDFDTEPEAEQAAREMLRRREPVTTERIIEEWKRGHRKAWAA